MTPIAKPGPMTEMERFLFDTAGYLVIPDALTPEETAACLEAAKRVHAPYPQDEWRQLGATYEQEPAFENLIDHPSILPKVRAVFGDYFILQSSWCTVVPPGYEGGGYHQDGSGVYEFRRLATPTPLVQLRIGFFLTDQTQPDMGNMVMIPGSHNSSVPLPRGAEEVPIQEVVCGKPGTALMFHQGVYHSGTKNARDFHRYILHVVFAPPWLIPSDRMRNDPEFLARTTPLRRALVGEWKRPEEPFGMGYVKPPFSEEA
ncbi:MAG TPA: phytanoyl-CoA dioxygenase family protein [Chthonomonadaceae bacterium]|nr:phytanoyl-CoA dioxygenase family protein [Chthonomonadaceae bacterium]